MTFSDFVSLLAAAESFERSSDFLEEDVGRVPCSDAPALLDFLFSFSRDPSADQLLRLSGLSQAAFCRRYHLPIQTMVQWRNGSRACPAYTLQLLAYAAASDALRL